MAAVLRVGALLAGMCISLAILFLLSAVLPGAWLPIAFALVIGLVLGSLVESSEVWNRFVWALAVDVFVFWAVTTEPIAANGAVPNWQPLYWCFYILAVIASFRFVAKAPHHWLAVLLALASVIAFVSGSKGGADPMLAFFHDRMGLSVAGADLATFITRKTLHFCFYGATGGAALLSAWQLNTRRPAAFLFAASFPLCLAAFDEIRQSTYHNRTGSILDVMLDMLGAMCVIFLVCATQADKQKDAD